MSNVYRSAGLAAPRSGPAQTAFASTYTANYQAAASKNTQMPEQSITKVINHTDVVHDTQFDYYGKLLASASSDHTVGIYQVKSASELVRIATLVGHEGPVWMVAWAHPRYGSVLASAGFDKRAIIWKESQMEAFKYIPVHVIDVHRGSVNAVNWAPDEYGLIISTASSDGTVGLTSYHSGRWHESILLRNKTSKIVHAMGATCVSFAPFHSMLPDVMVIASGGCDCHVRLWAVDVSALRGGSSTGKSIDSSDNTHNDTKYFSFLGEFDGYQEWIRDVAFCPASQATRFIMLAACSQDKTVRIYRMPWEELVTICTSNNDAKSTIEKWERSIIKFDDAIWRLSWAPCGEVLVVTTSAAKAYVLRQGVDFTEPWIKTPLEETSTQTEIERQGSF